MLYITDHASQRAMERLGYYPWEEDHMFKHKLTSSEVLAKQQGKFIVAERSSKTICVLNKNKNTLVTLYPLETPKKNRKNIPTQVFIHLNKTSSVVLSTIISMLPKGNNRNLQDRIHKVLKGTKTIGKTEMYLIAKNEELDIAFQICRVTHVIKKAYKASSRRYVADLIKIHEYALWKRECYLESATSRPAPRDYELVDYSQDEINSSEEYLSEVFGYEDSVQSKPSNLSNEEKDAFLRHFSYLQNQMESLNMFLGNIAPESAQESAYHLGELEQLIDKVLN